MISRRLLLISSAIAVIPVTVGAQMSSNSLFRIMDLGQVDQLRDGLLQLVNDQDAEPAEVNRRAFDLAMTDPVAMFIMWVALGQQGTEDDQRSAAARSVDWCEAIWGGASEADRALIAAIHAAGGRVRADKMAMVDRLDAAWETWFDAATFFGQVEAISLRLPPAGALNGGLAAYTAYRAVTANLLSLLGYGAHRPTGADDGTAASRTPFLFEKDTAVIIAQGFEGAAVQDDALLFSWFYAPSFDIYLAYGALPPNLPRAVREQSGRLDRIYAEVNAAQMARFAEEQAEMEN
jgi:hypothetical protein